MASETQRFEVNDMLRSLGELFPSLKLPDAFLLSDPEAAEDPVQRIAGFLEELANASLFPDRNLGQLILLAQDLVQVGCEALESGEEDLGSQRLAIAGFYYTQYLGDTIGLLAPDSHESLRPLWQDFAEEGEEDEGKADCQELLDGLEQA